MKCLACGKNMEKGTAIGIGQGIRSWYGFTSDKEKKGAKGFFTKHIINISPSCVEFPAWYCPECKKILMWMDSKE